MTDAYSILNPVLDKIAKEKEYGDYKKELKLINSDGANYTSKIYNITLSAPGKDNLQLFAKVAAMNEQLRSVTTKKVFETETTFYTTILRKYREFEEKYNFPEDSRMVLPKYYGGSIEYMKEALVLEELTSKGFEVFDRFKCYDWEYASKCISALARFHAFSIRYEKDYPEEFRELTEKLKLKLQISDMKAYLEKGVQIAIAATADEYKARLIKFAQENITEEKFNRFQHPKREIVINHNDIRPSNVLHKRDKNGNLVVVILDYQGLQKGNPVADLLYFLVSGSDAKFREKHWNQYFEYYYEEFSKTLRWMEINPDDVYSKADYDTDVKEMIPYGLSTGMFILPLITVDAQNAPKVEDGINMESLAMEASNLFKKRFNDLVKDYMKLGLL